MSHEAYRSPAAPVDFSGRWKAILTQLWSSSASVRFLTSGHLFIVATLRPDAAARRSSDPLVYLRREYPTAECDAYVSLTGQLI